MKHREILLANIVRTQPDDFSMTTVANHRQPILVAATLSVCNTICFLFIFENESDLIYDEHLLLSFISLFAGLPLKKEYREGLINSFKKNGYVNNSILYK